MSSIAASYYVFRMRQRFGLLTKWEAFLVISVRWLVFVAAALPIGATVSLVMLMLGASVRITNIALDDLFFVALGVYSVLLTRFYFDQKPTRLLPWLPPLILVAYWTVFFIYPLFRLVLAHI